MAIFFAGVLSVNAQNLGTAVTCPGIQTLDCSATANPLNPVPGTEYTYEVTVNPTGGQYHWFVTTDPNFMSGGVLTTNIEQTSGNIILAAGTGYNDPSTGASTQNITWQGAPATGDVFLVIHYTAPAGSGCENDNLKVYKINILNNFAIDVYTISADGGANTALGSTTNSTLDVCAPKVQGAKYENDKMVYDYGTTYLYYVIAAGNFMDSWNLQFKIETTLDPAQVMKVDWSNDGTTGWTTLTAASDVYSISDIAGNAGFNQDDCIVVRVEITNNTFESLADQTVKLVADATSAGKNDVATDCNEAAEFAKGAIQTIKPRPTVTNGTTGGDFIPSN